MDTAFLISAPLRIANVPRHRQVSVPRWRACTRSISPAVLQEYERYLRNVAKAPTPAYLDGLLHVLTSVKKDELQKPNVRDTLHPFLVPLTVSENGTTTGLLRWPTPPSGMDLPVVTQKRGEISLRLEATSSKIYVERALAGADFSGRSEEVCEIRSQTSLALSYQNGDVDKSGLGLERFVLMHVGPFADIYEGLVEFHLAKGDVQSALVTCERAGGVFAGWGRAHVFHAGILKRLERENEARDAARFSLQMPLWTLGGAETVRDMGRLAGYVDDESLGKIYRRLFEDLRKGEIEEGKAPQQVALDRAAYLLDVVVAESGSGKKMMELEEVRESLAELYLEAGLDDVATFVRY